MIAALVIGTILAVGALGFVLYPIFFGVARVAPRTTSERKQSEQESAVTALREIEFDRATGKLSETDYADLKTRYTREAVEAMRRESASALTASASSRPSDDELEAVVRAYREQHTKCPTCGPRPEPDAVFCSNCGRYLRDKCAGCGAPVEALDARYCVNCGNQLAA
ncbi:MAG TPA: zinc ribbon domain-containing protein [Gemmatimonadaceae bacterium]